jgi:hypothetical protein
MLLLLFHQVVCDAKRRIINFSAKFPGSVHDARIFRLSNLAREFEEG